MGHTQFIPTSYLAYAVDWTGDGKRDIWGSKEDALASTANYLAKAGWKSDQALGLGSFPASQIQQGPDWPQQMAPRFRMGETWRDACKSAASSVRRKPMPS